MKKSKIKIDLIVFISPLKSLSPNKTKEVIQLIFRMSNRILYTVIHYLECCAEPERLNVTIYK